MLCSLQSGSTVFITLQGSRQSIPFTFLSCQGHLVKGTSIGGGILTLNCNDILSIATLTDPLGPGCTNQTTNVSNTAPITVVDNNPATPYPSNIAVSGLLGTILNVTVTINGFTHSLPTGVGMLLVGPQGQTVDLFDCAGGTDLVIDSTITFDDSAATQIPAAGPVVSGTFQPSAYCNRTFTAPAPAPPFGAALSVFNGTNPNGIWQLFVQGFIVDETVGEGNLSGGWTLNITTCEPT